MASTRPSGDHATPWRNYSYNKVNAQPRIPRRPINTAYEHPDPLLSLSREQTQSDEKWRPVQSVYTASQLGQSPTSSNGKHASPTSPVRRSALLWWYLELLSLIAAVLCLGSIVGVLLVYDKKPLHSWPSSIITLNGLIALLSTLHRTFLMVSVSSVLSQAKWDELSGGHSESGENVRLGNFALFEYAAQGLGGCFQVLWKFKGRHTACIGAYLTITSLAFGFFSQQLITTQVESVASRVSEDVGDVSRATFIQGTGGAIGPPPVGIDTKMAMLNGCASKNTTIDPPQVNCATGNCTWPIIPTLGVCGACVNLTDTIVMEEKNSLVRGNASISCLAKAKGGTELDLCEYTYEIFNVGPGTGQVFKTESTGTSYGARNFIGDLAAIGADRWDGDPRNRTAGECAFWYCVQARNVSVQNGVLKDEVVDTWTEHEQDPQKRLDLNFTNIPRSFDADPKESYGLGPLWLTALQTYWNETVRGNVTTSIRGDGREFSDSYVAEGLMHNMGDIKAWGARFAESMTNQLRSTGVWAQVLDDGTREAAFDASRSTQQYKGLAWKSEVIIRVRWAWISYPASILLLALVYLIVEVLRSARAQDIRPWRNDPLVTLFMTVDGDLKGSIRSGLEDPLGVSRTAGDCRMRVVKDQDGLPIGFHAKQD